MNQTTKEIFEKYQVRKTRRQKAAFAEFVNQKATEGGYQYRTEKGMLGARNLIVGDPDTARVVFTAHYDTCARLPFPNWISPNNFLLYLLYQIGIILLFMLIPTALIAFVIILAARALSLSAEVAAIASLLGAYGYMLLFLFLLLAGPANRHTANDNTSGVTVLLDIMQELPEELRPEAAFVFFDLEEAGLFGSAGFASRHKKAMQKKLLINFDCVSDGEMALFALRRRAKTYEPQLRRAFCDHGFDTEVASHGVFYPSDQINFPCGVGVACLRRMPKLGILYMGRIHTVRDTVYQESNIAFLTEGSVRLVKELAP